MKVSEKRRNVRSVEMFGWPVVEDENVRLDPERPYVTGGDGDVIAVAQPLEDGRVALFMVVASP